MEKFIQMGNQAAIDAVRLAKRGQILQSISQEQRVISFNEFEKAYPTTEFDRFTPKSITDYVADLKKSEDYDEGIVKSSLGSLFQVRVTDGESIATIFVKRK